MGTWNTERGQGDRAHRGKAGDGDSGDMGGRRAVLSQQHRLPARLRHRSPLPMPPALPG